VRARVCAKRCASVAMLSSLQFVCSQVIKIIVPRGYRCDYSVQGNFLINVITLRTLSRFRSTRYGFFLVLWSTVPMGTDLGEQLAHSFDTIGVFPVHWLIGGALLRRVEVPKI
jgi:hypothetical protein